MANIEFMWLHGSEGDFLFCHSVAVVRPPYRELILNVESNINPTIYLQLYGLVNLFSFHFKYRSNSVMVTLTIDIL